MVKQRFFMVWNIGNRAPAVQHKSLTDARAEGERLARNNPGQIFVILESLSEVSINDVNW